MPAPERRRSLADKGYVAPHYPRPYGRAAGPAEQLFISQEFSRAGIEQPRMNVGEWVVPTILSHGSDDQRKRFVVPSLRGEITWCQLFSEPGAGSDLASLSTKADKVEGGWRLNGQKVWTSYAHEADWGMCLARTDGTVAKRKGLSCFLVDMRSSGVDIRPLRQATGASEFNEVFLDDVFVPDNCLVGETEQGWMYALTTLANERFTIGATLSLSGADAMRRLAQDATLLGADAERVLGLFTARDNALSALALRSLLARLSGAEPGPAVSVAKVASALLSRACTTAVLDMLGPLAAFDNVASKDAVWNHVSLPIHLIGGGTLEIQLNVIADRVLGLPR
jgi:alkylation response protein AidB-like acyl-CoA dehydrogenase